VLLYLAQEAATGHCDLLRLDWDTMARKGLFWAVIRTHVQVERLPFLGDTIQVKTWPMPTTRTAFPRAVEILDTDGNTLVRVVSLWVLMDRSTRAMVLPGKSGVDVPGLLCGNELAGPGSILPVQQECVDRRKVVFTELDRNGHMNNTRYMDWVNDLLPAGFHKEHPVAEFTICYLSEALENQVIDLAYGMDESGIFQVDGYRQQTDDHGKKTRIFSVKTRFK
jgi:acyl-ACP thioesterase